MNFLKELGPERTSLAVVVQPNAKKSSLVGSVEVEGRAYLKIKIAAPPVDGAANAEVVRFFAELFDLRQNRVRVVIGETSRMKVIELAVSLHEAVKVFDSRL